MRTVRKIIYRIIHALLKGEFEEGASHPPLDELIGDPLDCEDCQWALVVMYDEEMGYFRRRFGSMGAPE